MSVHLQNELESLKMKLLQLGAMAETSIEKAGYALRHMDRDIAKEIIESDEAADLKEVEIEEDCLKIMALHTPVANDLRYVVATLKINNDLERVCDLACNISKRVKYLAKQPPLSVPFAFDEMWSKVLTMLNKSIDAFITQDSKMAFATCDVDDEVDAINRDIYKQVYECIKEKPEHTEIYIHYLSISRALERVADYATNIAEDVIYMVDGRIVRHQPPASLEPAATDT